MWGSESGRDAATQCKCMSGDVDDFNFCCCGSGGAVSQSICQKLPEKMTNS